jgi:aspartokinase/homoserine dehydrogenase 1
MVKAYEAKVPELCPERPRQWRRVWVLKFGGSSVGKRLPRVCESIFEHFADAHRKGKRIAVVVSAMGKTTDLLLDAAAAAREQDLEGALKIVKNIESLVVNNASETFKHFDVPEEVQNELLKEIADAVSDLLKGLNNQLKGVELLQDLSPRTLDTILSMGERSSSLCIGRVLDGILQHARSRSLLPKSGEITWKPMGIDATNFMCTDDSFGQARVDFAQTQAKLWELIAEWPKGAIPIFTGFIGKSTTCNSITTLGRNGSDYSAALIAAALRAEQLIINTDVPGVFTADPRLVPDAFPVPEMSYTEACELSMYGSKIFHPKSMLPLMELKIPMIIRNTSDAPDAPSTMIRDEDTPTEDEARGIRKSDSTVSCENLADTQSESESECTSFLLPTRKTRCVDHNIGAVCIASLEDLSFLTIRAVSLGDDDQNMLDVSGRTKNCLEKFNIFPIWSDQRAGRDASILVKQSDRERAAEALCKEFASDRLLELSTTEPVTLLSLVPKQHASRVGAASRFFSSLNSANVKIHRVVCGASTSSISCLIDGRETGLGVQAAHNAFNFPERVVSLLVLGNNRTSRGLIEELHRQRHHLRTSLNLAIRVCAVITEHGPMVLDSSDIPEGNACPLKSAGVALQDALDYMRKAAQSKERCTWREQYDLTKLTISSQLRRLPTPVLVDCNEFPRSLVEPGDL